ncbi:AcrR family transcriptional regulator [Paraburkholderia sp. RAU6.4a]|uniref:TetR/AcrR family transcriptional regulator n=1 Tax=unclassified Paraburkholderia TaxID=2615204 RepID=UPI001609B5A9|nr:MULTISPECIES: TetR/AcrR family transcriptional regulator [unclassified Paraburkholderia]MBB5411280.1 AcrR family transcriptional regulator [Paraburkholderia sp. HC6.4b]MBB5456106.1 AcrR family transcriptional regulator [Paraburkholderia sp. Kb1A]
MDELIEPATRRTPKGNTTREAIKLAAKRALAVDGFSNAKIADIMASVNRSPGAFYKYYPSKEALLHELLDEFRTRLKAEVNRPLNTRGDPLEHLKERLGAFWKIYRDDWPVATAAFQMSMADREFARAWHGVRQQGIRGMSSVIKLLQKEGYCAGLDSELIASALCSMLEYTGYNWTARAGDFPDRLIDDGAAIEVLTRLVLNGVRGGAAETTAASPADKEPGRDPVRRRAKSERR